MREPCRGIFQSLRDPVLRAVLAPHARCDRHVAMRFVLVQEQAHAENARVKVGVGSGDRTQRHDMAEAFRTQPGHRGEARRDIAALARQLHPRMPGQLGPFETLRLPVRDEPFLLRGERIGRIFVGDDMQAIRRVRIIQDALYVHPEIPLNQGVEQTIVQENDHRSGRRHVTPPSLIARPCAPSASAIRSTWR